MGMLFAIAFFWKISGLIFLPLSAVNFLKNKKFDRRLYTFSVLTYLVLWALFFYYASLDGAFNISGHGTYEEPSKYLFGSYCVVGTLSCLLWFFHIIKNSKSVDNKR